MTNRPFIAASKSDVNQAWFDRFSLVHASYGAFVAKMGGRASTALLTAVAFEFAERELKRRFPDVFPNPSQDSAENMVGDVVVTMVGYFLTKRSLS